MADKAVADRTIEGLTRAGAAMAAGEIDQAAAHLQAAAQLCPDEPMIWALLGEVLLLLDRPQDGLGALDRALALAPEDPRPRFHRARAFERLDRLAEALADQEALAILCANKAEVWHNLGLLRRAGGDPSGAEAAFGRALALEPSRAESALALAHSLLGRAAWAEGFAHYEARLSLPGWQRPAPLPGRRWRGEDPAGRTLLVSAEQGLGDGVQFLRYLPLIKGAGKVIVECHPPLRRLIAAQPGVDATIAFGEAIPDLGAEGLTIPLASLALPLAGGAPLGERIPYVSKPRLRPQGDRPRIGLAWRSSDRAELRRDPPLAALAALAAIPAVDWVSLQFAPTDYPALPLDLRPMASVDDLDDTAALIADLDLVISVDTAVAHLAGAMGKPLWVLLGPRADWRWTASAQSSPWYPSCVPFFHGAEGWPGVIAAVSERLKAAFNGPPAR
ncbi:TPR repeat [Rhodospirillum rubrum ATCC 11170]|uniref:TPR repeat n=1 Tax=Rhodospirillum rubrum (strain ATCC 11170 / ATH 1.1.1 / DSM 467 / LMG 4362 / NCIMB 8255 / S1) TaxID=269796 RepID=Q2RV71_RHORT|nr:TPR repeat [Rhodospirillum rubrum ATCC 11170]MBK5953545.1 hypothetical protein [Rhodospirillum rubrum]HCF18213.1 tetratricopeptide repeat protein [Rhodospirillum rubrum]